MKLSKKTIKRVREIIVRNDEREIQLQLMYGDKVPKTLRVRDYLDTEAIRAMLLFVESKES